MTDDYTKARDEANTESRKDAGFSWNGELGAAYETGFEAGADWCRGEWHDLRKVELELAEAKALIEQMAETIDSVVFNFECDEKCQCCMNNKGIEDELKQALDAYEKWKGGE